MSRRTAIASALGTMLSASGTGFITVKTVNNADNKYPYDLTHEELPAIKIYFADEGIKYGASLRALNKIAIDFYIYSIEWDKDTISTEESLLKSFRDVVGNDIALLRTAEDLSIRSIIKMEVQYPLVMYKVNADVIYEESIRNL